jgi:putative transposase
MSIDKETDGPCLEDRKLVYARARMSRDAIDHVESMVLGSPSREVGGGALTNVVTRFYSQKNGGARTLESHTCESICAYELELDPMVIGYYAQVPCRAIERVRSDGRRHVTAANLDFLVFRHDSVELIECKQKAWLERIGAEVGSEWILDGGIWRHLVYESFARKRELDFRVWTPPYYPGVYLQNLEACYAILCSEAGSHVEHIANRALSAISKQPASLAELSEIINGFNARIALWMLGKSMAFGPWKHTPILPADQFWLYSNQEQASIADAYAERKSLAVYTQSMTEDPLLLARSTDLAKARCRLDRAEAVMRGEQAPSRRMRQLIKQIQAAVDQGQSPLSACLTNYAQSGNRLPRLEPAQYSAMNTVIARFWNRGKAKTPKELFYAYQDECAFQGVNPSGRTAFCARLKRESQMRHALNVGGMRAFQAIRPASDTRMRSLSPLGYGHTLHIDSSKLDNRIAPDVLKCMPASTAVFYIGVDGATGEVMAHSLVFGSARTDGIAILLRNYVRRHGSLPNCVHVDRGPENRSTWIKSFAEGYSSVRWSPTAGSAWNGLAENTIKQVNASVAHQLMGSTKPDQLGRKVDGRFKSYRNAKTSFEVVRDQVLRFIYEDLPNKPDNGDQTPLEKKFEAIVLLGKMGNSCTVNEDFLIRTSIAIPINRKVDDRRGIRTEEGYFTSDELINALQVHDVQELRSDCEDPTVLRVNVGGRWIKAFHSRVQSMALWAIEDKLFYLMYAPWLRSSARVRRQAIGRATHDRIQLAKFSTASDLNATVVTGDVHNAELPSLALPENAKSSPDIFDKRRSLWNTLVPCTEQGKSS